MSSNTPFQLKHFDVMIKTCTFFWVSGFVVYFMMKFNSINSSKRAVVFSAFFFTLFLVVIVARLMFIRKKNERVSLWLLYFSILASTFGIPLFGYIIEEPKHGEVLILICSGMLFFSILLNLYVKYVNKYGIKLCSQRTIANIAAIPILILLVTTIYIVLRDRGLEIITLNIGIIFLSGALTQHKRIKAYFDQKEAKRYGESVGLVEKLKAKKERKDEKE